MDPSSKNLIHKVSEVYGGLLELVSEILPVGYNVPSWTLMSVSGVSGHPDELKHLIVHPPQVVLEGPVLSLEL